MFEFLKMLNIWYVSLPKYVSVAHLLLFFVFGVVFIVCGGGLFVSLLVTCGGKPLLCAMFWIVDFPFSSCSRGYELSRLEKYLKGC
jgi:hypothetical protein